MIDGLTLEPPDRQFNAGPDHNPALHSPHCRHVSSSDHPHPSTPLVYVNLSLEALSEKKIRLCIVCSASMSRPTIKWTDVKRRVFGHTMIDTRFQTGRKIDIGDDVSVAVTRFGLPRAVVTVFDCLEVEGEDQCLSCWIGACGGLDNFGSYRECFGSFLCVDFCDRWWQIARSDGLVIVLGSVTPVDDYVAVQSMGLQQVSDPSNESRACWILYPWLLVPCSAVD